jgi:tripartite-type tricarboxylate transporter receptor subunit TctC
MTTRRQLLKSIGAAGISAHLGIPAVSNAQAPVVETLRIIVGFPPGGTSDGFARRLASKLQGTYAANAIVENRAGAGGQIAVTALRESVADGSVMLLTPAGMLIIYPHTYPKLPYTINDVTPVSTVNYGSHGFGVGPQVPASVKTLREFLDWAKANPALANYGSPAAGSMPHLVAALLEKASGVPLKQIPYRGSAPGIQDLLGGQIGAFSSPLGDYMPYIGSGRLRLLAVTGTTRSRFAPDVPTYAEQGFPELTMREWTGVFMPPRTPAAVAQRAHAAVRAALLQKEMIDFAAPLAFDCVGSSSPEEFARVLKADHDRWGPYVRRVGFTAES